MKKIISINKIDEVLPQIQCKKCGYEDCYNYAKAITNGENYNRCVTGGNIVIEKLAKLLEKPAIALEKNLADETLLSTAKIDESLCIGCKKCILSCPVDAIVGAKKMLHTVITDECCGCQLCIVPCPMNCISLEEKSQAQQLENLSDIDYINQANYFREKYNKHQERVLSEKINKRKSYKKIAESDGIDKKALILKSLQKFREKKKNLNKEI